jgi:vitamin B12 transporter
VPLLSPLSLRLLPLRKIEGFFVPAFSRLGNQKRAALAGRIANRKQVTMQIPHFPRKAFRTILSLISNFKLAKNLRHPEPRRDDSLPSALNLKVIAKKIRHPERSSAQRNEVEGPGLFSSCVAWPFSAGYRAQEEPRPLGTPEQLVLLPGPVATRYETPLYLVDPETCYPCSRQSLLSRTRPAVHSVIPSLFLLFILSAHAANPPPAVSDQTSPAVEPTQPVGSVQSTAKPSSTPTQPKAAADAAPIQPVPTKLPTILVTAPTRNTQPVATTATTTTVLTNQFLDDGKYASVPEALQSVPGLSVVTSGMPGGQTSVFIHGLDARETLVTVDGRRQAVGLSGADDNLANLTLDNIDQIEAVRTPVSSSQGGSAMGGVINLVTLSGKGVAPEGSVSEEAGSFNTFRESARSRGQVGDFDYAVAASRQDSIYPALSPGDPANFSPGFTGQADQYRNTNYRGNFGYQLSPEVYLDLHTAYSNAYTSSPGEYVFPDPTANLLIEDWSLSPEVVAKVTDFYTTKLYYTRDQQRQAYDDPYYLAQAQAFDFSPQGDVTRLQINTDSVDWQNDFQIAHNWSVTAGIQGDNINYYEYDDGLGYRTFDGHENNLGGYISSQWQPIDGLNILNSGRYDSYSQFGGAFSWRQAVSYLVAPTQTLLHASVSSAFTPPSLQDLYYYYPGPPAYLPNPALKPETDIGWEAGVEQPFLDHRVTPSVTFFDNDVQDYIGNKVLADGDNMEENLGHVTTYGVEAGLKVKPCSTVSAAINYTYLSAVDDTTQARLVRRPRNSLDFTGTWNPIAPLTLTLGGNWVVGRQDIDVNYPYSQVVAPDYFVLRASAGYRINDHVEIWVRGENLTDRNYQPVLGYFAPSIAGYGGIKVSF